MSKIQPIHKRGSPEPRNFRPVSMLSRFSKVIEKASDKQLEAYTKINFPNERQFAYKENHGCQHPILLTRHLIETELQKGNFVCLTLIDLSLAFDTLECGNILPAKLKFYGADEKTVSFFRSFFTGRKHYAEWKGASSNPINLYNHSCVQGSCLGPKVYNHYTQELSKITKCECICFADDTNFILSDKDPNSLIRKMNKELEKTDAYMTENTLIINKEKTYYLLLTPKGAKRVEITEKMFIKNTEIKRVNNIRFLGIWIDDKLSFKKQYDILYAKLQNTIRALIFTKNTLTYKAKLLVYNALFRSYVDFGAITYFDKLNKTQLEELTKLQKNAIRLMFSARKNVHTDKLFKLSNITPINKLYEIEAVKFIFRYISANSKDEQPPAIKEILFKQDRALRSTRLYDDESKVKIFKEYRKGQCIYNLLDAWNKADEDLRMAGNLFSLNRMIKEKNQKSNRVM